MFSPRALDFGRCGPSVGCGLQVNFVHGILLYFYALSSSRSQRISVSSKLLAYSLIPGYICGELLTI